MDKHKLVSVTFHIEPSMDWEINHVEEFIYDTKRNIESAFGVNVIGTEFEIREE